MQKIKNGYFSIFYRSLKSLIVFQIDESELEAELEALGDEIALDGDSSYLDEAVSAPGVPSREPGAESTADGVAVDEFGLPKIPAR